MAVITIRQKATRTAGVSARLTSVEANENTVIVIATAAAPKALWPVLPDRIALTPRSPRTSSQVR